MLLPFFSVLLFRTGNNTILSEIKERYGGLKRFLEDQDGITVHDDHPFNPSVTLDPSLVPPGHLERAMLQEEGSETAGRGRKKRGGRRRKNKEKQQELNLEEPPERERQQKEVVLHAASDANKPTLGTAVPQVHPEGTAKKATYNSTSTATQKPLVAASSVAASVTNGASLLPSPYAISNDEFPALS